MKKQNIWSLNFSTAQLTLIPIAIGINFIGKFFTQLLKLPLWLDSLGTVIASMLGGPIVGALSGFVNNIIYGFVVDPFSFAYSITSVFLGLTIGILYKSGFVKNIVTIILSGTITGLVCAIVSTPLNIILGNGMTGNFWGDALYTYLLGKTPPSNVYMASFLDEVIVDVPDKIIVVFLAVTIVTALPNGLKSTFENNNTVERI